MGLCSRRYVFLTLCIVQMLLVVERQVFDFLGFLWIPILVNFFEIIFVILGFFGAYQYRPKYIISYVLWQLFWLGWNIFLLCLYLDLGILDHKSNQVLKLDPNSDSWWSTEGPGCEKIVPNTQHIETVRNCLLNYIHIELVQSSLQGVFAVLGIIFGICLSQSFLEEDDTSSRKSTRKNSKRMSLYSIEFSSQIDNRPDSDHEYDNNAQAISPKPMTPRRVKRRSVMTRGSSSRQSTGSRRHQSHSRSSTRSSRRMAPNPVTRLMEQNHKHPYDSPASPSPTEMPNYYNTNWHAGHSNPTYQQSSTQSLNEDFEDFYNNRPPSARSSYSNFHGTRTINYASGKHYHSHATPQVPQKRSSYPNRNSMRSAFLNSGPPAYSSQQQAPVDSETTI